jgi:RNA polymerase sigma-70 factor (ECF subfamily)
VPGPTFGPTMSPAALDTLVSAVSAGDELAFAKLSDHYRRRLQSHCYRVMGSVEDSEDLVQETFLRAWQNRASFRGPSYAAWLYRIATNVCLDALKRRRRRPPIADELDAETLLERIHGAEAEPLSTLVNRETVELAFSAAVRHLPPRQRAALVLRAVLGWSSKDAAHVLESSVASVNSALQRARQNLNDKLPERRLEWAWGPDLSEDERSLLQGYLRAVERAGAVS